MSNKSIQNTLFADGFVCKLKNRRIICYKIENSDSYMIEFIRFTKEEMTKKEIKSFNKCIKKMSGYLTIKMIKISEEALMAIIHTGFHFFNPQSELIKKYFKQL